MQAQRFSTCARIDIPVCGQDASLRKIFYWKTQFGNAVKTKCARIMSQDNFAKNNSGTLVFALLLCHGSICSNFYSMPSESAGILMNSGTLLFALLQFFRKYVAYFWYLWPPLFWNRKKTIPAQRFLKRKRARIEIRGCGSGENAILQKTLFWKI